MKYYDQKPIRHVGDVAARGAAQYGDRAALVYRGDELSYADLEALANRVANALVDEGVEPGDRVGVHMENNLRYMPVFFGAIKAGAIVVPLNFRRDDDGLVYVVRDADVDVILGSEHITDPLVAVREATDVSRLLVPGGEDGLEDYDEWVAGRSETFDRPSRDFDDVTLQCYTSGTTGDPKGVLTTHENVLTTLNSFEGLEGTDPERETILTITPLFHLMALMGTTMRTLYGGGTVVMRNLPEPDALLEAITEYGVTSLAAVPAIYIEMVNELEANPDRYDVSTVEGLTSGAAPLADDTRRRIEGTFGTPLVEGWGMTETTAAGTYNVARGVQKSGGCIGQPMPDVEMKLVDPETRETRVPPEHLDPTAPADLTGYEPDFDEESTYTGEIAIRGPHVFDGYHALPEKNAEVFDEDGWFYTEDIARVDEERSVWMVDRADDMLIVGGENVYPAEVEDALFHHEAVDVAAVVGAPHEIKGEAPVAYVVPAEGHVPGDDVTEEALRRFALENVPPYAHPRRVFFVDELPRSGTEKVQRYKLEERVREHLDGPLTSSETL